MDIVYIIFYQPGMHVNGAPPMMQPPNMGVPGPMPGPGAGPGAGPVGPPGNHETFSIEPTADLVMSVSFFCFSISCFKDEICCQCGPINLKNSVVCT